MPATATPASSAKVWKSATFRTWCRSSSTATAYPHASQRTAPPYSGAGRRPPLTYRENAPTVKDLALAAGSDAAREVTWRQGSRHRGGVSVPMHPHFLFLLVRPAARAHRRAHRGQDLPVRWLIVEWPPDQDEPTRYWFSDLPSTTPEEILVRLAKLRWRIEHDYRELKHGLGLDHYEGRTWAGWHHHVTLVSAAHGFLTLQRLDPKDPAPA